MNGGELVADVLERHGVRFLFTLCGGHISPILVGAKRRGIRVVDVRHEVNAVFAADAVARLTGVPGVAAVTAGPGVTNTITAIKNAQLAQSPLVLLGGAAATCSRAAARSRTSTRWPSSRRTSSGRSVGHAVRELVPALERAFAVARSGVPGPVFVECPVDLLYDESLVREWYAASGRASGAERGGAALYLGRHLTGCSRAPASCRSHRRAGRGATRRVCRPGRRRRRRPTAGDVRAAAARLRKASGR